MVIGVGKIYFRLPGNRSLKGKRQVVKKILSRVRAKYNVSISEVGDNDIVQRAVIGITTVGNQEQHIQSTMQNVLDSIYQYNLAEILDESIEIIHL